MPPLAIAEGLALRYGLCFAHDLLFPKIQVETDCVYVAKVVNSTSQVPFYFGMIAADCKSLGSFFHEFSCLHIKREANHVAHLLAKFTLVHSDCIWIEEAPTCISATVAVDFLNH